VAPVPHAVFVSWGGIGAFAVVLCLTACGPDWIHVDVPGIPAHSSAISAPAPTSGAVAVVVIPPPRATAPPAAECDWAIRTLAYDAQLDDQEAAAVANGVDTTYGTDPAVVTYYQDYAAEWRTVGTAVRDSCATTPAPLTAAQRSGALSWFTKAADAHLTDTAAHPESASWDQQWEANYARLTALVDRLP
jgi:hypothetical protein